MKKLPIGIQNLREIREEGYYYVDKTPFVKRLFDEGKYYFLSRPRRFGKSLFLDTLKEAFSGNRNLFKGLYLEKNWDWKKKYPVIRISFGSGVVQTRKELDRKIKGLLKIQVREHVLKVSDPDVSTFFQLLIHQLYKKSGPVVILIDEYDKPILDNITNPTVAAEIREGLKNLYSVIKDADPYLKLVFLTGVSKFSKVSLFSGLNNLKDITLDEKYATIGGYTENDLDEVFVDRLTNVDRNKLKTWYNGYNFLGERVYNPFDILLFLDSKIYKNYWFETGTPTFLVKLIQEKHFHIPDCENLRASEALLGSFDVDQIELPTLLFQTGYLTIKDVIPETNRRSFSLAYPNLEVKTSLNDFFLTYLTDSPSTNEANKNRLEAYLKNTDLNGIKEVFQAFFASIPHNWHCNNPMAQYEGYYASIVYCYFAALGLEVIAEDTTNLGRIDLTVLPENNVFVFEFKVIDIDKSRVKPLEQIKAKGYADKYRKSGLTIFLVGIEFNKKSRNITSFAWEKLPFSASQKSS